MENKKNILITGIAGLLGSNLADWIIKNKKEYNVICIDDLSGGVLDFIPRECLFYKQNLAENNVDHIFKKHKIDIVFHFAAYAAEGLSPFMRKYNYNNNLISTIILINLSINYGITRFVFTSSMATYGYGNPPFKEEDDLNPIDPYGIAKYACEMDLKVANQQHGLDYCIIKPHNVYGIKQNIWDKYRNVLGIWMLQHLNGKPLTIFGDGSQKRAFSYIGDCLKPLWNAGVKRNASCETINLGGKKEVTIDEAGNLLIKVMGDGKKEYKEERHEVKEAWSSWEKSVSLLEYYEKHTLQQGLEIMWLWAKKQPKREIFEWNNFEIEKKIYSFWKKT